MPATKILQIVKGYSLVEELHTLHLEDFSSSPWYATTEGLSGLGIIPASDLGELLPVGLVNIGLNEWSDSILDNFVCSGV